jgi:hypothetical protein
MLIQRGRKTERRERKLPWAGIRFVQRVVRLWVWRGSSLMRCRMRIQSERTRRQLEKGMMRLQSRSLMRPASFSARLP